MASERNYKEEYLRDHSGTKAKKHRARRNKLRREALQKGVAKKGDGKETDHRVPMSKGGSDSSSNTRIVSRATNRKKQDKRSA